MSVIKRGQSGKSTIQKLTVELETWKQREEN